MDEKVEATPQQRQPQTRAEQPNAEDPEKYQALNTLVELGLLIPINKIERFHGRAGKVGQSWRVDPAFANSGNATGNDNVNERSTIYTSDAETAREFAASRAFSRFLRLNNKAFDERVKNYTPEERQAWLDRLNSTRTEGNKITMSGLDLWTGSEAHHLALQTFKEGLRTGFQQSSIDIRPEVYEIVSRDPHAMVIYERFDPSKLDEKDRARYNSALQTLTIPITEGSPVNFADRNATEKFMEVMKQLQKNFIFTTDVEEVAKAAGISKNAALHLASAYNSAQEVLLNPAHLADRLLDSSSDIFTDTITIDGKKQEFPINLEYAQRYMRNAHIVAIKQSVSSATLGKQIISVSFFDLEVIGTQEQIDEKKKAIFQRMAGMIDAFSPLPDNQTSVDIQTLFRVLKNPYIKPETLVNAAKQIGEFRAIYESDAGNWEGFTLEEHTETVLRNFEENFADIIPVEYLAPMRLAILAHDLGKPLAVARGEKYKQKEYNAFYAKSFLNDIGIDPRFRDLLIAIITDGSSLAFRLQREPDNQMAQTAMRIFAEDALRQYFHTTELNDSQIEAFTEICKIFQLCDGGAYTSMAITRRGGKGRFRNAPSFNESFQNPIGPGRRDLKYKRQPNDSNR